jgi:hypothetical protein
MNSSEEEMLSSGVGFRRQPASGVDEPQSVVDIEQRLVANEDSHGSLNGCQWGSCREGLFLRSRLIVALSARPRSSLAKASRHEQ